MTGILALAAMAVTAPQGQGSRIGVNPPKLVVLISIDQFRGDYVERFNPYFLPARSKGKLGGFRFLTETGAHFSNAMHNHLPTETGPGHATLMTGSEPAFNGIIANSWFDPNTLKGVYCVQDPGVETVGGKSGPMSPKNLTVTTVGDELEMATNDRSKVVGVAIKDRASILMAGHAADTVIWWDSGVGNWVTSSWYAPNKQLPEWVQALNAERPVDKAAGAVWEPLLADDAYRIARRSPAEKPAENGKPFSHKLSDKLDSSLFNGMISSPVGNDVSFAAAKRAVEAEKLGQNDVPDILVLNLSTNDYVGHRYGPNSPEVMDITVRTDRQLSDFLNHLNAKVPGGIDNVAVVISGDHGVVPVIEEANDPYKFGVQRGVPSKANDAVEAAFDAKYGDGKWILGSGGQNVYLNRALAREKGLDMRDLEAFGVETALASPGIYAAYGRHQVLEGRVPHNALYSRIVNGYHNQLGGDLYILEGPGQYDDLRGTGTGHGSVWDYDAHVPIIIRAKGIKPGSYTRRVHTSDIAPTLSRLLGLSFPTGNVGQPLVDKLER